MNLCIENKYDYIPTHIENFDGLVGGGLPLGRITELYGGPNIGKTKLIFDIMENILSLDKNLIICYISSSNKTLSFIKSRGLDKYDNLIVAVTNKENEIIDIIKKFINISSLIIVDSLAETLTNSELTNINLKIYQDIPKLLAELNTICYSKSCAMLVTNHIAYKDNDITSKWNISYKKYCSLRIYMNDEGQLKLMTHKLKPYLIMGGGLYEL